MIEAEARGNSVLVVDRCRLYSDEFSDLFHVFFNRQPYCALCTCLLGQLVCKYVPVLCLPRGQ